MTDAAPTPGDVVELRLDVGFGHVLVTHSHPVYGEALRLWGVRADPAADLAALARRPGPLALFPLGAALAAGRIDGAVIGRAPGWRPTPFPAFKTAVRDRNGAPLYWWLWDGASVRPTADAAALSGAAIREVLSPQGFLDLLRRSPTTA